MRVKSINTCVGNAPGHYRRSCCSLQAVDRCTRAPIIFNRRQAVHRTRVFLTSTAAGGSKYGDRYINNSRVDNRTTAAPKSPCQLWAEVCTLEDAVVRARVQLPPITLSSQYHNSADVHSPKQQQPPVSVAWTASAPSCIRAGAHKIV